MHRRAFLAALTSGSAALAGCATTGSGPTTTTGDPRRSTTDGTTATTDRTTSETTDEPTGPQPPRELGEAAIVDLETAPLTYALSPNRYRSRDGAQVWLSFTRTATADHPATVEAFLRNENGFPNTFRLEATPPFGHGRSKIPHDFGRPYAEGDRTYRSSLVFAPTEETDLATTAPDLERDGDGLWRLASEISGEWFPENVRLEPGETVRGEFALVGRAEGAGKGRPTGVYEFRSYETDLRLAAWETGAPGPGDSSRFEGVEIPPISPDDDEAETTWYHEADRSTETYVRPSEERVDLPAAVEFTFVNHAREAVGCGHWNLYKLVDGSWYHLGPWVHTADCRRTRPGGTVRRTLEAYHHDALDGRGPANFEFGHLGGGRYAMVSGYAAEGTSTGALVEFEAPDVAVVPTDDATASRSGSTVTVTTDRYRETRDGQGDPARLTATRSDDATRAVIAEQVMRPRFRGLRNLIAQFDSGVEKVVLKTSERVAERVVPGDDDREYLVAGEGYSVELASVEDA